VDIIADLIAMYQEQAPHLLTQMQGAVDRGDGAQLSMSAHKLNGSSAALGAVAMRERCGELEQMGVDGELSGAGEIIQATQRAYQGTVRALVGRFDGSAEEQVIDKPPNGT
jgi:HPt (histidine-containing phosphotransfer) domain-containing protein